MESGFPPKSRKKQKLNEPSLQTNNLPKSTPGSSGFGTKRSAYRSARFASKYLHCGDTNEIFLDAKSDEIFECPINKTLNVVDTIDDKPEDHNAMEEAQNSVKSVNENFSNSNMGSNEEMMENAGTKLGGGEVSCTNERGSFVLLKNFFLLNKPPSNPSMVSCRECENFELSWPSRSQNKEKSSRTSPDACKNWFSKFNLSRNHSEQKLNKSNQQTTESNKNFAEIRIPTAISSKKTPSPQKPIITTGNCFDTNLQVRNDKVNKSFSEEMTPRFIEDIQSNTPSKQPTEPINMKIGNSLDANETMEINCDNPESLQETDSVSIANINNQLAARMAMPASNNSIVRVDEFDAFAKLVACQLRLLPLDRSLECQNVILQIVINERIRMLPCQSFTQQEEFEESTHNSQTKE